MESELGEIFYILLRINLSINYLNMNKKYIKITKTKHLNISLASGSRKMANSTWMGMGILSHRPIHITALTAVMC
ncbi:hypothetical protein HYX02_04330 [Candidatus Woesearchaeota archaeon]|nr:hypothetical protein [Candidatus Woesearchaeota archaeon]